MVVMLATPPLSVPMPSGPLVTESVNVTEPVGVPDPGGDAATVAVKVTAGRMCSC